MGEGVPVVNGSNVHVFDLTMTIGKRRLLSVLFSSSCNDDGEVVRVVIFV